MAASCEVFTDLYSFVAEAALWFWAWNALSKRYRYYTYMQGKVPCAEPLAQRALHKNQLFCGAFVNVSY